MPYVDPMLVTVVVVLSIAVPVRIGWQSMMGLLNRAAARPSKSLILASPYNRNY